MIMDWMNSIVNNEGEFNELKKQGTETINKKITSLKTEQEKLKWFPLKKFKNIPKHRKLDEKILASVKKLI